MQGEKYDEGGIWVSPHEVVANEVITQLANVSTASKLER